MKYRPRTTNVALSATPAVHHRGSGSYPYNARLGRPSESQNGTASRTMETVGESFAARSTRWEATRLVQTRQTEALRTEPSASTSGTARRGLLADHGLVQAPQESNMPGEPGYPVSAPPLWCVRTLPRCGWYTHGSGA
eukprot:1195822-Prorocentrum_minimum.AAC.8